LSREACQEQPPFRIIAWFKPELYSHAMQNEPRHNALVSLAILILAVAAIYFGKPVLMPLALSILFAFLLSPIVDAVHQRGIGRNTAVIVVVLCVFSFFGMMIWGLGSQLSTLADQLPEYKDNIRAKMIDIRSAGEGSPLEKIQTTLRELRGELQRKREKEAATAPAPAAAPGEKPEEKPVPVVVKGKPESSMPLTAAALWPLLEALATAGLVVVMVIFMLLRRRELRNRVILLFGYGRLPATTMALDEAGLRISRYLLMQSLVNASYGLAVGIACYGIGLPYALLWGFFAGLMRFIPYVGPWLGAAFPVVLSLAVFPGWFTALIIIAVFAGLELVTNMLVEPLLYGHTVGVSEVALLIAVAFWTWVWGPIGLALATPLTVCIVVLGKYVPGLSFIQVLMGDEPVMEPEVVFYQRLLALDKTEAKEIFEHYLASAPMHTVMDKLLLSSLVAAKRDFKNNKLPTEIQEFILQTTEEFTDLAMKVRNEETLHLPALPRGERKLLLAIPAEDEFDEAALHLLRPTLAKVVEFQILSHNALSSETVEQVEKLKPSVVCVASLPPGGSAEIKYLSKRIKAKNANLKVAVARWGLHPSPKKIKEIVESSGADVASVTLEETRNQILALVQLSPAPIEPKITSVEAPFALEGFESAPEAAR
jgi:predicted PurR-regulated permease PerM